MAGGCSRSGQESLIPKATSTAPALTGTEGGAPAATPGTVIPVEPSAPAAGGQNAPVQGTEGTGGN